MCFVVIVMWRKQRSPAILNFCLVLRSGTYSSLVIVLEEYSKTQGNSEFTSSRLLKHKESVVTLYFVCLSLSQNTLSYFDGQDTWLKICFKWTAAVQVKKNPVLRISKAISHRKLESSCGVEIPTHKLSLH